MTTTDDETTPVRPDLSLDAVRERVLRGALPDGVEPVRSVEAAAVAAALRAAESRGDASLYVLVPAAELRARADGPALLDAARAALGEAGLVLVSAYRVRWSPEDAPPGGATRLERLDADTRELLLQAAPRDRPATVELLDARLRLVERELDALAERQVEHAVTRTAELMRAHRLEQLEKRTPDS